MSAPKHSIYFVDHWKRKQLSIRKGKLKDEKSFFYQDVSYLSFFSLYLALFLWKKNFLKIFFSKIYLWSLFKNSANVKLACFLYILRQHIKGITVTQSNKPSFTRWHLHKIMKIYHLQLTWCFSSNFLDISLWDSTSYVVVNSYNNLIFHAAEKFGDLVNIMQRQGTFTQRYFFWKRR